MSGSSSITGERPLTDKTSGFTMEDIFCAALQGDRYSMTSLTFYPSMFF